MPFISKEKPCGRCYWNNDCGDSHIPIVEGRSSHCEDGSADQYDEYPNATKECSGFTINAKLLLNDLKNLANDLKAFGKADGPGDYYIGREVGYDTAAEELLELIELYENEDDAQMLKDMERSEINEDTQTEW